VDKVAGLSDLQSSQPDSDEQPLATLGSLLWLKIELSQRILNTSAQQFWSSENLARLFPSFLLDLYSLVSCSVPLMRAAHQRASELAFGDVLAAKIVPYLEEHIEEETHHDEWLLNDLVASGMDRTSVVNRWPTASVASLVGTQYCWIHHAHPAAIFGYLAVIEGNPPLAEHLNELQLRTGFPPEAFRCLHQHAADDIEHLKELRATVISLPLSPQHESLIATSAYATADGLIRIFEDLKSRAGPARQ
jgi:Iron-containing redox enzyme